MYFTSHIKFYLCYFVILFKVLIFNHILAPSLEGFQGLKRTPSSKMANLTSWHFEITSLTFLTQIPICKVFKCFKCLILLLFNEKKLAFGAWIFMNHLECKFFLQCCVHLKVARRSSLIHVEKVLCKL